MKNVHISAQRGVEITFPAGYLNRARRRKLRAKTGMR